MLSFFFSYQIVFVFVELVFGSSNSQEQCKLFCATIATSRFYHKNFVQLCFNNLALLFYISKPSLPYFKNLQFLQVCIYGAQNNSIFILFLEFTVRWTDTSAVERGGCMHIGCEDN